MPLTYFIPSFESAFRALESSLGVCAQAPKLVLLTETFLSFPPKDMYAWTWPALTIERTTLNCLQRSEDIVPFQQTANTTS